MGNLLNRIYDFFAFSLPGACLIIAVLLFPYDKDYLIYYKLPWNDIGILNKLLIIALAGYVVGYIITPLARYIILRKIAVPLFTFCTPRKCKNKEYVEPVDFEKDYKKLKMYLASPKLSEHFVKIRKDASECTQYIEFWDMHISMASNMALAAIVLVILQLINIFTLKSMVFIIHPLILILTGLIAFVLLMKIALKYSFWWMNDIEEASK